MSRQERPVDPGAGPLQAFAHELRKVRVEAGSPTYRALARTAGYSPATLSEAANGLRRPSLEVVLAYVGACGGDVAAWLRRWHELDAVLSQATASEKSDQTRAGDSRPAPESAQAAGREPVAVPGGEPPPQSADPSGRPARRWRRPLAYGLIGALAAATATAVVLWPDAGPEHTPPPSADGCPTGPDEGAAFTAETYGSGVHVRSGPARDHPVRYTIPAGCRIGLVGYCLGEKILDGTAGTPDVRWYRTTDGGLLTSALVHGLPPAGLDPSDCEHGLPPPSEIRLSVSPDRGAPDQLRLETTGVRVDIVGFAVHRPVDPALPATRRWYQITFADAEGGVATAAWRPETGWDLPVPVVAVACLGGQGPTDVLAARMVDADASSAPAVLDTEQRAAAGRAACRYPDAG